MRRNRLQKISLEFVMVSLAAIVISACGGGGSLRLNQEAPAARLSLNPSRIDSGNVALGQSNSQRVVISNSGPSRATIFRVIVAGAGLSVNGLSLPFTLAPGQSASFNLIFAPTKAGTVTDNILVVGKAANSPVKLPFVGTGIESFLLSASPTSVSFGNVRLGDSSTQNFTLNNTGSGNVTVSQAVVTGSGLTVVGLSLPAKLTPRQTSTFRVVFAPTKAATLRGSISLLSDAANSPATISLSGTAVGLLLTMKPSSTDFGSIVLGSTSTLPIILYNMGTASLTISQATVTGTGFNLAGLSLPLTLAAGANSVFNTIFAPTAAGSAAGNIAITSDASDSPDMEPLSGTGVHAVVLSWTPDGSSDVVGYNVYRGDVPGGPYSKLNSSLVTAPSYTDQVVEAGQTYYYVATAQDSAGRESRYSDEAKALIPSP